jgi:Carboxypeptidase regulatory-like domain
MRALALIAGLLALLAAPAAAQIRPTGVNGFVLSADTKKPLVGAQVAIYHMPMGTAALAVSTLRTNDRGFFSNITLEPGRYLLMTTADGLQVGCITTDLQSGVVNRIRVEMAKDKEFCIGKSVQSALVVPGQTADVYIIH